MEDESNAGMGTGMVIGILVALVLLVAVVVVGTGGFGGETAPISIPNGQTTAPSMEETDETAGGDGGNATLEVVMPETNIAVPDEIEVNVTQPQE